jgi:hypothetical protein
MLLTVQLPMTQSPPPAAATGTGVSVGAGVFVGGTGVLVGGTAVGGTAVFVGGAVVDPPEQAAVRSMTTMAIRITPKIRFCMVSFSSI